MAKAAKKTDVIHFSGKRKRAIARATVRRGGSGIIKINNIRLDHYGSVLTRARILEPVKLAGESAEKVDILVKVRGGGVSGQADAVRLAIARGLAVLDTSLRSVFLDYDRQLLVADVRRKESAKPNSHGQARSKTQKSYR
jgi:small subunit ribosomal protein S9